MERTNACSRGSPMARLFLTSQRLDRSRSPFVRLQSLIWILLQTGGQTARCLEREDHAAMNTIQNRSFNAWHATLFGSVPAAESSMSHPPIWILRRWRILWTTDRLFYLPCIVESMRNEEVKTILLFQILTRKSLSNQDSRIDGKLFAHHGQNTTGPRFHETTQTLFSQG